MIKVRPKKKLQLKRVRRIRAKISGTHERPRLTVYKSNYSMYVQIIDDDKGLTIVSHKVDGKNIAAAKMLGKEIAAQAKSKKISGVVFDRRGYRYHGAVKALADAVREGGLVV
jgi:large subunit ribosomal protein L18